MPVLIDLSGSLFGSIFGDGAEKVKLILLVIWARVKCRVSLLWMDELQFAPKNPWVLIRFLCNYKQTIATVVSFRGATSECAIGLKRGWRETRAARSSEARRRRTASVRPAACLAARSAPASGPSPSEEPSDPQTLRLSQCGPASGAHGKELHASVPYVSKKYVALCLADPPYSPPTTAWTPRAFWTRDFGHLGPGSETPISPSINSFAGQNGSEGFRVKEKFGETLGCTPKIP